MENTLNHVAIIMDGNRRWAAKHKLAAVAGHEQAARKTIQPLIDHCLKLGIKYLTLWAFSTENWKRDKEEVSGLMNIFRDVLKENIAQLHEKGVRLNYLGQIERFPKDIADHVRQGMKMTEKNQKIMVTFALNYGGRDEILRAVKKMIKANLKEEEITEEKFSGMLDTAGMPDPDLVIRTGGQFRLSGYLPWQSIYSELYFTPVLFPDFSPKELNKALEDYSSRNRRFGGGSFKDYTKK